MLRRRDAPSSTWCYTYRTASWAVKPSSSSCRWGGSALGTGLLGRPDPPLVPTS